VFASPFAGQQHQQHMRPGATSVAFGRGATVMVPAPTRDDADVHTRGTPPRATAAPQQLLGGKRPPLATTSSPFGHGSPSRAEVRQMTADVLAEADEIDNL
jgi:hypothetical protein